MNEHQSQAENSASVAFIPPAPSPTLISICQSMWPAYAKLSEYRLSVHLDRTIPSTFKNKLREQRVIICPNHCAHDDPIVAFALSAQLDQQFYYLTAREIFMHHPSLRSLWLQHLGCYSVLRSSADIDAYKQTCSLITQEPHKVVIFPEGEVTHQNRFVLGLECGPVRMALAAAEALTAVGQSDPVYLLPVGFAYRYKHDIMPQLLNILAQQEKKLSLQPAELPAIDRVKRAFDRMLSVLENEHHCKDNELLSLGMRINRFVNRTIDEIAGTYAIDVSADVTQRDRLHALKKIFINQRFAQKRKVIPEIDRVSYRQLKRALNLIAITDQSFENVDSQERLAELICILEFELSGKISLRSDKNVYVASSKPLDAQAYVALYSSDKHEAIRQLNIELQNGIHDALTYLSASEPEHSIIV